MTEPIVKKHKKKKDPADLLKTQKYLFDRQLFEMYLTLVLKEEANEFANLLRPNIDWKMTDEFVLAMHAELTRLLKRHVEKSSFFGKYRMLSMTDDPTQKVKKEKVRVNVKESDFHFGWKAMKTDVMGE